MSVQRFSLSMHMRSTPNRMPLVENRFPNSALPSVHHHRRGDAALRRRFLSYPACDAEDDLRFLSSVPSLGSVPAAFSARHDSPLRDGVHDCRRASSPPRLQDALPGLVRPSAAPPPCSDDQEPCERKPQLNCATLVPFTAVVPVSEAVSLAQAPVPVAVDPSTGSKKPKPRTLARQQRIVSSVHPVECCFPGASLGTSAASVTRLSGAQQKLPLHRADAVRRPVESVAWKSASTLVRQQRRELRDAAVTQNKRTLEHQRLTSCSSDDEAYAASCCESATATPALVFVNDKPMVRDANTLHWQTACEPDAMAILEWASGAAQRRVAIQCKSTGRTPLPSNAKNAIAHHRLRGFPSF